MRLLLILAAAVGLAAETIQVTTPMPPPAWAYLQRALLKESTAAAHSFAAKYVDPQGHFRAVERWGGNDGPDDVMETFHNWPLAYALGADESLLALYERIWEGHLDQYQKAKAPNAEMAKNGMYWREFPTAFDWEHNGEGLAAFYHYALCRPQDRTYRQRAVRFANFYNGTDPLAPNYDKQHKIIRSLHNGSRGSKVTDASVFDWGGEAEPGTDRHTRYKTAANIRGDHPLNLLTTTLGINAYLLTGDAQHRNWVLEYASAWRDRILANNGNVPTNIGLNGVTGGEWNGKWYGGTFGWNFDSTTSSRNYYMRGVRVAMGNAWLLTRDASYFEPLQRQLANLYAAQRVENGRILLPNKHGDNGWWGYGPNQHFDVQRDLWLWQMNTPPPARLTAADPWIAYLAGQRPNYPEDSLRNALSDIRRRTEAFRNDASTPDTRASDHAQRYNPVVTSPLLQLATGANDPGGSGSLIHARLRYFDPQHRRAGLPEDVAALVDQLEDTAASVTLVNLSQTEPRTVTIQAGAYAEHAFTGVTLNAQQPRPVTGTHFTVQLAPGAGARLRLAMRRYANPPTLRFPWD